MVRLLRLVLGSASVVLLPAGYFAGMAASMQGDPTTYALRMDSPPIRALALILLVAAIGSCFMSDEGQDP